MTLSNKIKLGLAHLFAQNSNDARTKVGCAIFRGDDVLSIAWNEFPFGVKEAEGRREAPLKYKYTEHAERNAIYNCAKYGRSLWGSTMYLPWYPCADCARAIIQSGIKELVCYSPDWENLDPKWAEDFKAASVMLLEAEIVVTYEVP